MSSSLHDRLASALPRDARLTIHHCSALPTRAEPLFVAAPGSEPEATELESHFLSASVKSEDGLVQAFAVEILCFTTATLTTLFVAKADSTGYLHLLNLPQGGGSLIRTVLVQFLSFLIESKKRGDSRLVLSLFARAQDQYLFPGSIENSKKHVLDDRGLIKWWAKIISHVVEAQEVAPPAGESREKELGSQRHHVRGHLVVPGIDAHETRTFFPRDSEYKISSFWQVGDPLKSLGIPDNVPERCLVPRFPDDPKARFAIDLDDELPQPPKDETKSEGEAVNPAEIKTSSDRWRSVRSLAQFWELLSYRQECSAGRLVGFLWGIWEPEMLVGKPFQATVGEVNRPEPSAEANRTQHTQQNGLPESADSQEQRVPPQSLRPATSQAPTMAGALPNPPSIWVPEPIAQAAPEVQIPVQTQSSADLNRVPPPADAVKNEVVPPLIKQTPAQITLTPDAYARSMELLLTLDYCDLASAVEGSGKFLGAIAKEGELEEWGVEVVGTKSYEESNGKAVATEANSLAALVRKRPKAEASTLSAGLVRKKPKVA